MPTDPAIAALRVEQQQHAFQRRLEQEQRSDKAYKNAHQFDGLKNVKNLGGLTNNVFRSGTANIDSAAGLLGAGLGALGTVDKQQYSREAGGNRAAIAATTSRNYRERLEGQGESQQIIYESNQPQRRNYEPPSAGRVPGNFGNFASRSSQYDATPDIPVHRGEYASNTLEYKFVKTLAQANQDPGNPDLMQNARSMFDAMSDQDGSVRFGGQVNQNINGHNINMNFSAGGARETVYTSFDSAAEDIARKSGMRPAQQRSSNAAPASSQYTQEQSDYVVQPLAPITVNPLQPLVTENTGAPDQQSNAAPTTAVSPTVAVNSEPKPNNAAIASEVGNQIALNREAQLLLERMGQSTGNNNHRIGTTTAVNEDAAANGFDGIVGAQTLAALKNVGIDVSDTSHAVTAETVEQLKKNVELAQRNTTATETPISTASAAPVEKSQSASTDSVLAALGVPITDAALANNGVEPPSVVRITPAAAKTTMVLPGEHFANPTSGFGGSEAPGTSPTPLKVASVNHPIGNLPTQNLPNATSSGQRSISN